MSAADQLEVSDAASDDLIAIWQYTAGRWGVDQADHYVDALERTFKTLLAMPEIGRERSEFVPPVRIHPSGEHIVIYLVEASTLVIVRILHQRMDIERHLGKGEM